MLSAGAASADKFRERGVSSMLGFQAGAQRVDLKVAVGPFPQVRLDEHFAVPDPRNIAGDPVAVLHDDHTGVRGL